MSEKHSTFRIDRTNSYHRTDDGWKRDWGWHIWVGPLGLHALGAPWHWRLDWSARD